MREVTILKHCRGWDVYATRPGTIMDPNRCGKWMYFFEDKSFVSSICETAVETGIVDNCKHSDAPTGVACFYLHCDDTEGHRRVLEFFLRNNLIKRTGTGRLHNISFKLDKQTRAGQYGADFRSDIRLENFMNLDTGEFLTA